MAGAASGVTSQQQLELARARFAAYASQQPSSNYSNGQATNPGAVTTAQPVAQPAAAQQAAAAEKPVVMPHIHVHGSGTIDDSMAALSHAISDPTTDQRAAQALYDFQKQLFDMQKQSTSLWLNPG